MFSASLRLKFTVKQISIINYKVMYAWEKDFAEIPCECNLQWGYLDVTIKGGMNAFLVMS